MTQMRTKIHLRFIHGFAKFRGSRSQGGYFEKRMWGKNKDLRWFKVLGLCAWNCTTLEGKNKKFAIEHGHVAYVEVAVCAESCYKWPNNGQKCIIFLTNNFLISANFNYMRHIFTSKKCHVAYVEVAMFAANGKNNDPKMHHVCWIFYVFMYWIFFLTINLPQMEIYHEKTPRCNAIWLEKYLQAGFPT